MELKYAQIEPEKRPTMSKVVEMLMNKSKEKMLSELEANYLFKNPYSSKETVESIWRLQMKA